MSPIIKKYIFFAIGLLSAVWFFVGYPSQDPRSFIDIRKSNVETIEQNAREKLKSLGFNSSDVRFKIRFYSNQVLLENLQKELGRSELITQFQEHEFPNLILYYWDVQCYFGESNQATAARTTEEESPNPLVGDRGDIRMRFDPAGNFIEFINVDNLLPVNSVNRSAIAASFKTLSDTASQVLSSYSDTELRRQLLVDVQQNWNQFDFSDEERITHLKNALRNKQSFRLSTQDVFNMASFHLQQTGWNTAGLVQDTVHFGRMNGDNTVAAQFHTTDLSFNQELSLDVRLTTTGGLVEIQSNYEAQTNGNSDRFWDTLKRALIFLFGLAGVVLFFYRIRARAIDTQPALIVSIISGLVVSLVVVLNLLQNTSFFTGTTEWMQGAEFIMRTGIAGAVSSLAFFVFFAIGDSITRQHWPQKLNMYDYIRQGMIFNKPIGYMIVLSVTLAFILAGVWTLILWLVPQISFHIHNELFISQQAAWSPLFLGLSNGVFSLALVIGIFLVLGGQAYAQTGNKYIAALLMVLACGIVVPFAGYLETNGYQMIGGFLLGIVLVGIYLQWNFLTLLLSHFLFSLLTSTTTGWLIAGSLDNYIFIGTLVFFGLLLISGFVAIGRGKEEKILPRYVPEYVEELAQEERIKQELQIAREVQQSFLPVQTPDFKYLDLAAICKPAYETGGDYYDFIKLDDKRVAVTIGDVSGKGIQAAFYMTFIKGILHSLCREIDSPAEILKKTNRLFCENAPRGTFISLVYGIIDLEEKTFRFARAGHNPILRVNTSQQVVEELQPQGIGIGLTDNKIFDENIEEVTLNVNKDDVIVLYTDGIVEALNSNHNFYGAKRLNNLLLQNKKKSAADILEEISFDVKSYVADAEQHDDMTMLVMKWKNDSRSDSDLQY